MNWPVVILGVAIVLAGVFLKLNVRDPALGAKEFSVVSSTPVMEELFAKYAQTIDADLPGYKNHCYRVLSYARHFLDGNEVYDKYLPIIGTALVYHDIGLWTDHTLAYLEPSSSRALEVYKNEYNDEELELLHNIIYWHHKINPFEGKHADIVNAVRKADWIDATQGMVHQRMPGDHIKKAYAVLPPAGFYDTLQQFGPRLYGNDIVRIVKEMTSILKW